jgi:hypothetical protein
MMICTSHAQPLFRNRCYAALFRSRVWREKKAAGIIPCIKEANRARIVGEGKAPRGGRGAFGFHEQQGGGGPHFRIAATALSKFERRVSRRVPQSGGSERLDIRNPSITGTKQLGACPVNHNFPICRAAKHGLDKNTAEEIRNTQNAALSCLLPVRPTTWPTSTLIRPPSRALAVARMVIFP